LPKEIYNAIICANGELCPNYKYIQELREINERIENEKETSSVGMQGFTLQM